MCRRMLYLLKFVSISTACFVDSRVSKWGAQIVQLLIHAMLIRYFYIRSSKRSKSNTEIQSSNIFKSDIRPSLEEHGFFKYFLGIFEIFEKQISMFNAYFQKKRQLFSWWWSFFSPDCSLHMLLDTKGIQIISIS